MSEQEPKLLKLNQGQVDHVETAQQYSSVLMNEGQTMVREGQNRINKATVLLRRAVEGAFRDSGMKMPETDIRIVPDDKGRPAALTWSELDKKEADKKEVDKEADKKEAVSSVDAETEVKPVKASDAKKKPATK